MSVLDTLKAATPNRQTVTTCLDGALQAEWEALSEKWTDAAAREAREDTGSLAMTQTIELADQLDEIRDRMTASMVTFTFQQMPWKARIRLQAEHPPRDGNIPDRLNGFNVETYFPALIKASVIEVAGADGSTETTIPDDVWAGLIGDGDESGALSAGQIDRLARAARHVNEGETTVPPSARSLLGSRDSGASLAQPSPGTSAPSDSEAGNPPGSPSTSTTTPEGLSEA